MAGLWGFWSLATPREFVVIALAEVSGTNSRDSPQLSSLFSPRRFRKGWDSPVEAPQSSLFHSAKSPSLCLLHLPSLPFLATITWDSDLADVVADYLRPDPSPLPLGKVPARMMFGAIYVCHMTDHLGDSRAEPSRGESC